MHDLAHFTLADMTTLGATLRRLCTGAGTMEEAATRITRHIYLQLADRGTGVTQCALVRFFKTHPHGSLPPDLQAFARRSGSQSASAPAMRCLTLLGTAGDRPEWNARQGSARHQAIPLCSVEMVNAMPMIANLGTQFGLKLGQMVAPTPELFVKYGDRSFNVFHVQAAPGSPLVPAQQEFVLPLGIRSVLGFGGMLTSGDLFATILFTRVTITREIAEMFATIALNLKVTIPRLEGAVFAPHGGSPEQVA